MPINIIVAHDLNNAIGYDNKLLAHLPDDLKRFKQLTQNDFVVQGRKTFESIVSMNGKPLPNRTNIVISKTTDKSQLDYFVYDNIDTFINDYKNFEGDPNVWIIGGEQIYKEFLPHADNLYITVLHKKFKQADAYFPKVNLDEWELVESELIRREPYEFNYSFNIYKKFN
ncbi:dihydrofolate reductase [Alkalihalobacillus sp. NPDC078783]